MISMRFAEHYYRNILDIRTSKRPMFSGLNGRETAMHQNMMWVLETQKRQRPGEKIRVAIQQRENLQILLVSIKIF